MSAEKRLSWLPDGCPAWCADPEGHGDGDRYDDRLHDGITTDIILTAEEPLMDGEPGEPVEGSDSASNMNVYLTQHYREEWPRIWVGKNQTSQGAHLTLAEAERLAHELLSRVAEATSAK